MLPVVRVGNAFCWDAVDALSLLGFINQLDKCKAETFTRDVSILRGVQESNVQVLRDLI